MSDDGEIDRAPDVAAAAKAAGARYRAEVVRLRRRWAMAAFDPLAHLRGATGAGNSDVLRTFSDSECRTYHHSFASALALSDILEIWRRTSDYGRGRA